MREPEPMVCYAWSFVGAPRPRTVVQDGSWIQIPGLPRLASTRAINALDRARSQTVAIYRCAVMSSDGGELACTDGALLGEVDAESALRYFAAYCARSVLELWEPDDVVRRYLCGGEPSLRADAFRSAWLQSGAEEGFARLAARVAMFAAHPDQLVAATREAARLACALRGHSLDAARIARSHQERVLSAALMLTVDEAHVQRAA